jgi:uncharacterized protein (DUF1697 family)
MKTLIILLRGLTPTGKNKVPMAPLRAALEEASLRDVRTYIQSGNVVVRTHLGLRDVEKLVQDVIKEKFGGEIVVFVRTVSYFKDVLARNPFLNAETSKQYFTLLATKPDAALLSELLKISYVPDELRVINDMTYVLCATKYSDIKINNNFIERKLKISATTRVYNTIANLVELAEK